jgi:MFS family permease
VATGLVLTGVAGVGMALVALGTVPGWAAFIAWPIAGLGAGFALTSASVSLLEFTNDADRGSDSAALQLADSSASALSTAFGGALVATAAHGSVSYSTGLSTVFLVMGGLGVLTIGRVGRLRPAPRRGAAGPGQLATSVSPSLAAP